MASEGDVVAAAATTTAMPRPELYVVMSNASGKQNLGTYLRTASAFGATQVLVVGSERYGTHGAHRAQKYVDVVHFYKFADARAYLNEEKNCAVVGVRQSGQTNDNGDATETTAAVAAHAMQYRGSTAFVIDNEIPGLSEEQEAICDAFVYVPVHHRTPEIIISTSTDTNTEAPPISCRPPTLDATVVTAIVLHHFTKWAGFTPRAFEATTTQGKFVLDAFPTCDGSDKKSQAIAAARDAKRTADAEELADTGLANIFG